MTAATLETPLLATSPALLSPAAPVPAALGPVVRDEAAEAVSPLVPLDKTKVVRMVTALLFALAIAAGVSALTRGHWVDGLLTPLAALPVGLLWRAVERGDL